MTDIILNATQSDWKKDIFPKLKLAWTKLKSENELFVSLVGERALTHRLALYLDPLFPLWNVDCEYNRVGIDPGDPKKIIPQKLQEIGYEPTLDADEAITVFPDISIHRRGKKEASDNLLVIEIKKTSGKHKEKDRKKLIAYVSSSDEQLFHYKFGLYFEIDMANKVIKESYVLENGTAEVLPIPTADWN